MTTPGPGRRTTGWANSAAGRPRNERKLSNSRGTYSPDPAATSVTAASAAVCCTLPVPPPLTNSSRGATARTARTASQRRRASSLRAAACITRTVRENTGFPATSSPTPATCPSYAISPTSRNPGRRTTSRASSAIRPGSRSGERRAPIRTFPPSTWYEVSSSRHTRISSPAPPAGRAASIRSSCAGSSAVTVTAAASLGSAVSSANPARSADGYASRTSGKPERASHSDSSSVKLMIPAKPSRASTRSSRARQRTDLLATRIGLPCERRTRSAALASKARRSTTASGASRWAVARS